MADEDKYLFVDEGLHFLTGDEAARALRERSDAEYLDEGKGVVRVPKQRWQEAQKYERDTWLVANAEASDDRNAQHEIGFGNYASLSGRTFHDAIELGCGPFTNLRIIARHCTIERCSLLDPLINEYLQHPHCTYDRQSLSIGETPLASSLGRFLPGRIVRRAMRSLAPDALVSRVPVAELLPIPIEEMTPQRPFDLIVMINVLEHCYDASRIFDTILANLQPGGILVFHDKLFDIQGLEHDVRTRFDAGHPLRVGGPMIESFLRDNFTTLYSHGERVPDEFEGVDLSRDGVYFIGSRKS
jgi:SAM-dependent methyltransferase